MNLVVLEWPGQARSWLDLEGHGAAFLKIILVPREVFLWSNFINIMSHVMCISIFLLSPRNVRSWTTYLLVGFNNRIVSIRNILCDVMNYFYNSKWENFFFLRKTIKKSWKVWNFHMCSLLTLCNNRGDHTMVMQSPFM